MIVEISIALCTGMVAATLLPPVRKSIPRPIEVGMWTLLVVACVIGVLSITNPNARELTASAFWGVDQVISTLVGLLGAGVLGWLAEHRFTIATWVTFIFLADILALALLHSYRQRHGWQPRVRLVEWMELPRLAPVQQPVGHGLAHAAFGAIDGEAGCRCGGHGGPRYRETLPHRSLRL